VFHPPLAPARYKGAYGGRGSGKSHVFARRRARPDGDLLRGAGAADER
jgi:hypothetical protein